MSKIVDTKWGQKELLQATLSVAVPLWIEELRKLPESTRLQIAHDAAQVIAEKGDIILYRSKKKGETAAAFNALAKGIAALAFIPGGVRIFDLHFEAKVDG